MADAPAAKLGRPTKYDPSYCEKVIEWGRLGKSIEWMCAELGVVYNTLKGAWPAANKEFAEALELAELLALQWWEDKGQVGITSREFNAQVYSRSMAARFPKKWRESKHIEATGADGAPLGGEMDLSHLSEEEKRVLAGIRVKGSGDKAAVH